jgi:hypothetical protein
LSYLCDNNGLKGVYAEGYTIENSKSNSQNIDKIFYFMIIDQLNRNKVFDEDLKNLYRNLNKYKEYAEDGEAVPFETEKETRENYEKLRQKWENYKYIPGADCLLSVENRLNFLPAEKEEVTEKSREYFQKGKGKYKAEKEQREDVVLEISSDKDDPMAVTVYGGGHSWKDNIAEWNKKHPDKKFSLIEITPESY